MSLENILGKVRKLDISSLTSSRSHSFFYFKGIKAVPINLGYYVPEFFSQLSLFIVTQNISRKERFHSDAKYIMVKDKDELYKVFAYGSRVLSCD